MVEHKVEHKEKKEENGKDSFSNIRSNPWVISTIVLIVVLIVVIFWKSSSGSAVSADDAGKKVLEFVDSQTQGQVNATVISSVKEGTMYKVMLDMQGQEIPVYVTLDGKYLTTQLIPMTPSDLADDTANQDEQPVQQDIPKSDKPVVELFVMSHCPYGTQIEKGILPVVSSLGNKIDFKIKWVYYVMHGKTEIDEQTRQHCIQTEQKDKYLSYLQCFLADSNSTRCLKENKVDMVKLSKCVNATDIKYNVTKNFNDRESYLSGQFPLFDIDKADNEKYNVGGSPTLIINGVDAQTARSPSALMNVICGAFTNAPAECSNSSLSSDSPSAGFGFNSGSGADSAAANCGV